MTVQEIRRNSEIYKKHIKDLEEQNLGHHIQFLQREYIDHIDFLLTVIDKQREALQEIFDCDGDNIVYSVHDAAEKGLKASE